jgi:hypothetical protein
MLPGRVAEWFKAAVLKTAVGATPPWVRIPPLPPAGLDRGQSPAVWRSTPSSAPPVDGTRWLRNPRPSPDCARPPRSRIRRSRHRPGGQRRHEEHTAEYRRRRRALPGYSPDHGRGSHRLQIGPGSAAGRMAMSALLPLPPESGPGQNHSGQPSPFEYFANFMTGHEASECARYPAAVSGPGSRWDRP